MKWGLVTTKSEDYFKVSCDLPVSVLEPSFITSLWALVPVNLLTLVSLKEREGVKMFSGDLD